MSHEGHAAPHVSYALIRLELISSGQSLEIVRAKCRQRENWQQEPVPKCDNFGQHWAMMNPSSRNHTFSESSGEVELMFYLFFNAKALDSEALTLTAGWLWAAARTAAPAS